MKSSRVKGPATCGHVAAEDVDTAIGADFLRRCSSSSIHSIASSTAAAFVNKKNSNQGLGS
jgi:hypothetical protein